MPSSYVGVRLGLLSGVSFVPGTVLSITSGNVTILNGGSSAVTVQDDLGNTVTGCTLVFGDGTKATASGQTVTGTANSGTTTVQATKSGYTSSGTVTFTCTGTFFSLNGDDPALSNGASVTSWTDNLGNAWANAVTPPTYVTGAINGHAAVAFNGSTQNITAPTSIAPLNGNGLIIGLAIKMTSSSPASNEQWLANLDAVNLQGWAVGRSTTNFQRTSYRSGASLNTMSSTTSTMTNGNWYRAITTLINGTQNNYLNGVVQAGGRTDGTYTNNTTAPPNPSLGSGTSNFANCQITKVHGYNVTPTATLVAQLDLYLKNWLGQ